MQQFVARPFTCSNPNEQTLGVVLNWMADNLMSDAIRPVMHDHGLDSADPDKWYPAQEIQDVARDLCKEQDTMNIFVAIGKKFAAEFPFPANVKSVPEAVLGFNETYHRINQNVHPDEGLIVEQSGASLVVTNNTPWPGEVIFGYLSSLSSRFKNDSGAKVMLLAPDHHLRAVFEVTA